MVAHGRLLEAEQVLEVADADGLAPGLEQPVEDPHAVAVRQRLEHALEPVGVGSDSAGSPSGAQHAISGQ